MIYDEITERDWYMYRRGEMREYIRTHAPIGMETYRALYKWVTSGHSVHENPWGIRDANNRFPADYIEAMNVYEATK